MICLADLVLIQPQDYRQPTTIFAQSPRNAILIPFHNGTCGNPVTFAASPADGIRHNFNHGRFCTDMDSPKDYDSIRAGLISPHVA
jgi:hypothetical protein